MVFFFNPVFVRLQDYNDHIAEISAKLVAIMDSLFEKVLSKVRSASASHCQQMQLRSYHCLIGEMYLFGFAFVCQES